MLRSHMSMHFAMTKQTAVVAYLRSEQLPLFALLHDSIGLNIGGITCMCLHQK